MTVCNPWIKWWVKWEWGHIVRATRLKNICMTIDNHLLTLLMIITVYWATWPVESDHIDFRKERRNLVNICLAYLLFYLKKSYRKLAFENLERKEGQKNLNYKRRQGLEKGNPTNNFVIDQTIDSAKSNFLIMSKILDLSLFIKPWAYLLFSFFNFFYFFFFLRGFIVCIW